MAGDEGCLHVAGDLLELLLDLPAQLVSGDGGASDLHDRHVVGVALSCRALPRVGDLDGLLVDLDHVVGVEAGAFLAFRRVGALEALAVGVRVAQVVALPFEKRGRGGDAAGESADGESSGVSSRLAAKSSPT